MTPLTLRTQAGPEAHLVARPRGVLHAYVGPLTPSGQRVPRAARTVCRTRTRTLRVVPLSVVGRRRVCVSCTARLARTAPGGTSHPSRASYADAYDGVTPFDLALDAWRAETPADVERVELLALLLVGYPACQTAPVIGPDGHENAPLDVWLARARARVGAVRDPLTPGLRAAAEENRATGHEKAKQRRRDAWREREDRIERLGFINATT